MGAEENRQLVRSFYEAGNRGEFETCFNLLADDVRWTVMGTTRFSGTYTGKAELQERLVGPLFGGLKAGVPTTVDELIAEGDRVVALTRGEAETLDGKPYHNHYCNVMRVRDGRIAEVIEYLDTELVTRVFGAPAEREG